MSEGADFLSLAAADADGNVFDLTGVHAAGRSGNAVLPLRRSECIPLPKGSEIFQLPGRMPLGFDADLGEPIQVGDGEVTAVAAFLAPAHTQLLLAPYETLKGAPRLPLFAYTAVGIHRGRFYVPALRVDPDRRQDIDQFPPEALRERAEDQHASHGDHEHDAHDHRCDEFPFHDSDRLPVGLLGDASLYGPGT